MALAQAVHCRHLKSSQVNSGLFRTTVHCTCTYAASKVLPQPRRDLWPQLEAQPLALAFCRGLVPIPAALKERSGLEQRKAAGPLDFTPRPPLT